MMISIRKINVAESFKKFNFHLFRVMLIENIVMLNDIFWFDKFVLHRNKYIYPYIIQKFIKLSEVCVKSLS